MVTKLKHYNPGAGELVSDWHVIDADDKVLGRLATEVATLLMGKHRPGYVPHLISGDFVVVTNAARVRVTGKKAEQITYKRHSQHPGNLKEIPFERVMERHPERVIEHAVKGMLPKNKLGSRMYRRLKVYAGAEHPHVAQVIGSERREEREAAAKVKAEEEARRRTEAAAARKAEAEKKAKADAVAARKAEAKAKAQAEAEAEAAAAEIAPEAVSEAPTKKTPTRKPRAPRAASTAKAETAADKSAPKKTTRRRTAAKKPAAKAATAKAESGEAATKPKRRATKSSTSRSGTARKTTTRRKTPSKPAEAEPAAETEKSGDA